MKGGLENMGLTCGINTLVQCLCHSRNIVATLSQLTPPPGSLTAELKEVITMLSTGSSIRPGGLISSIYSTFRGRISFAEQLDMYELYTLIAERIAEEVGHEVPEPKTRIGKAIFKQNNRKHSIWTNTVQGVNLSVTACKDCKKVHRNPEILMSLLLEVPAKANHAVNLSDLIAKTFAVETLTDYKCDNCKGTNCHKQTYIHSYPNVLVIILKRPNMSLINGEMRMQKATCPVNLLQDITIDGNSYTLVGTGNHYGNCNGGHYTATCTDGNEWIEYDDTLRRVVSFQYKDNTDAYLLLYEKNMYK